MEELNNNNAKIYYFEPEYFLTLEYPYNPNDQSKVLNLEFQGYFYPTALHLVLALQFDDTDDFGKEWRLKFCDHPCPEYARRLAALKPFDNPRSDWQKKVNDTIEAYKGKIVNVIENLKSPEEKMEKSSEILTIVLSCKYEQNENLYEMIQSEIVNFYSETSSMKAKKFFESFVGQLSLRFFE